MGGERPEVIPNIDRLWILILGTLCLVTKGFASPAEMATVVGNWAWPMQLCRPA